MVVNIGFPSMESVERRSRTPVRPEINQARHGLAFRALQQWSDRATLEGEIGSLKRGLDASQRKVVEAGLVTRAFRAYSRGRIQAPGTFNGINQPTYQ